MHVHRDAGGQPTLNQGGHNRRERGLRKIVHVEVLKLYLSPLYLKKSVRSDGVLISIRPSEQLGAGVTLRREIIRGKVRRYWVFPWKTYYLGKWSVINLLLRTKRGDA